MTKMKRKEKLIFMLYTMISLGPIGYSFRTYHGEYANVINGNGFDVALVFGLYYWNKVLGTFNSPLSNFAVVICGGCFFELMQKLGVCPGTYDPKDLVAYVLGGILAIGVDKLTFKNRRDTRRVEHFEKSTTQ